MSSSSTAMRYQLRGGSIRSVLSDRLIKSRGWRYLVERNSSSIEWHIGPAIASLFMHEYSMVRRAHCYLLPKGAGACSAVFADAHGYGSFRRTIGFCGDFVPRTDGSEGPASTPANVVRIGSAWMAVYGGDPGFWVDLGIGRRMCARGSMRPCICQNRGEFLSGRPVIVDLSTHSWTVLVRVGVSSSASD